MSWLPLTASLVGVWSYAAFDPAGQKIASGTITLRQPTKAERNQPGLKKGFYLGTKNITCLDPSKYGPHAERRREFSGGVRTLLVSASMEGEKIQLDLNHGWFDNNIFLDGQLHNGTISGTWGWSTFAGFRSKGTFRMAQQSARRAAPKLRKG